MVYAYRYTIVLSRPYSTFPNVYFLDVVTTTTTPAREQIPDQVKVTVFTPPEEKPQEPISVGDAVYAMAVDVRIYEGLEYVEEYTDSESDEYKELAGKVQPWVSDLTSTRLSYRMSTISHFEICCVCLFCIAHEALLYHMLLIFFKAPTYFGLTTINLPIALELVHVVL